MTSQHPSWLLGILLGAVGSFLISTGLVLQKYSHARLAGTPNGRGRRASFIIYFEPWWILGFAVYGGGQALVFVAMAYAPQATLSALSTLALVWIGVLAWPILGERTRLLEALSMACVMAGAVMVIMAVPEPRTHAKPLTTIDVTNSLQEPAFIISACTLLTLLAGVRLMASICHSGLLSVFWSSLSGVLSGYSSTLVKCVSVVVFTAKHPWIHWQPYMVGVVLLAVGCLQVHSLNTALSLGHAKSVVPVSFALGVLVQILNAQVAYNELTRIKKHSMFWAGVILVLVSMVGIVRVQLEDDEEEEDEAAGHDAEKPASTALLKPHAARSQSWTAGPSNGRLLRSRRHSSYLGVRNAADARGHIYPMSMGGLVVVG